jgi:hypothetical protein
LQSDSSILRDAYQCSDRGTAARPQLSNSGPRFLTGLAYCVIHASALYAFLTFALTANGVEFFYFYPREAQTILRPYSLLAIVWLVAGGFSVFGLIALGLRADRVGKRVGRWQLLAVILSASIALILILLEAVFFQYSVPFWWIGTIAVCICWLVFGDGITQMMGGRRQLLRSFFASLFGIGAILEICSLSHWLYAGVIPSAAYANTWSDLEMNLTYAWSWLFPALFLATWLSPIWAFIAVKVYRLANSRNKPITSGISENPLVRQINLGLDDFILVLVLLLISITVGFYPYLRDPSWLVGTDAYWRYKDPLQRIASSSNVLVAASGERHGLYLLILYGLTYVTGLSPFDIVKASPMMLVALLSVLTYLAVARFRRSRTEGFFAGFLSATTFPTTLGIFGSIDANWFALGLGLVTLCILISLGLSSERALWKALLATLCGMVLLILHPWTWGILAMSALVAGLVFLARKNWKMFAAPVAVFLSGLVSGALVFVTGSETEKARLVESVINFETPLNAPSLVRHPFGVIYDALTIWAPFLNPLLMILAMVGVVLLVRERSSSYKVFMLSWMVIAGVGTFFAVTLQTEIWRIWYVQPLWILGAAGIKGLLQIGSPDWARSQMSHLVAARTVIITCAAGLAVALLEPVVGSAIFYAAIISIVTLHIGGRRASTKTVFATTVILFVSVFFLDHAFRSLYPLILNPHNYLEH